jgi:hypothetical protein
MEGSWEYINKKLRTAYKGWCSTFGDFYEEPKSHRLKRHQLMAFRVSDLDSCVGKTLTKEIIPGLELWNVRSLYRSGSLYTRADDPMAHLIHCSPNFFYLFCLTSVSIVNNMCVCVCVYVCVCARTHTHTHI